jgi:hypothetical protein
MTNTMGSLLRTALVCCCGLLALPAFGQSQYEVGLLGLISSYQSVDVTTSSNSGKTGADFGGGGGFFVGQVGDRWGGEFRYLYSRNDFKVESGSQSASLAGQTHTVHYDALFYLKDSDSSVRPYLAVGGGAKVYHPTGEEQVFQPLSDLVLLTRTTQTRPVGDFCAGVKFKVGDRGVFRVEFRDYVSPTPKEVLTPSLGAKVGGILHQWTGLFGFSWTF